MKKYLKHVIPSFVLFVIICIIAGNFTIVPTGYTGVKVRFGQIQDEYIDSGKLNFTIPFCEHIVTINNKQQTFEVKNKIWGETVDKTPVYASDIYITYRIVPEYSTWIYANVTDMNKNLITESFIASAVKSAMVLLTPEEVTNRIYIEPSVKERLQAYICDKYNANVVEINKVIIGDMDFEEEYNQAIQAKSIATQEKARVEIENETKIKQAEAQKEVTLLNAQAEAEKIQIEAEAQANANSILQESINTNLLLLKLVELWDGKLPIMMGNTDNIVDIKNLLR